MDSISCFYNATRTTTRAIVSTSNLYIIGNRIAKTSLRRGKLKFSNLIIVKRKTNVRNKAFLTGKVNSILQCKLPLKYKDPGCPTITCMIGVSQIERALLDLGASVNLLPYSVYVQLELGELKPTTMTLQLADRLVRFNGE